MAKQNQNRKQTPDPNSVFKFTGIAMNRDGEPIVLTECGKLFLVIGMHGSSPTWRQLTDYSDHLDSDGI